MAPRSLNPHAAGNPGKGPGESPAPSSTPRRSFLVAFWAGAIGTLLAIFPFATGILTFFDPLLRRKRETTATNLLRVATTDSVPLDGTPVQVPVIADLTDAWNREPNQPIGAVYLRRDEQGKIICFNAICPHAGCFVGFDAGRKCFQCPCHTSAFEMTGKKIEPSPSPRDMDLLVIDDEKLKQGEIWIAFENYYPGKATRERKA